MEWWEGHVIQPDAITSDNEGNVYISDGANSKVLKIDSLTGKVLIKLKLEEKKETISALFWSDTEPNVIVVYQDRISSYSIPELY